MTTKLELSMNKEFYIISELRIGFHPVFLNGPISIKTEHVFVREMIKELIDKQSKDLANEHISNLPQFTPVEWVITIIKK
jgi:hypothetical protein